MSSLKDFMISKVRVELVELFFNNPSEMYFVREISRITKIEINAVRRELERMLGFGLLTSEQRGNRLYYTVNPNYLLYQELQRMVAKTTGLGKKIRKLRAKLGKLEYVMFSGKFVRKIRPRQDEVDMLVVGEVVLPELQALIKEAEVALGREINYGVFSVEEFEFRKQRRDPFVMDILFGTRILIVGDEVAFAERQPMTL